MTPDIISIYDYYREQYGWLPSEVDAQDAQIMEKFVVIDSHRELMRKKRGG